MHVYMKDGEYIVFPTLDDLIRYIYLGEDVERFYANDEIDGCDYWSAKKLEQGTMDAVVIARNNGHEFALGTKVRARWTGSDYACKSENASWWLSSDELEFI